MNKIYRTVYNETTGTWVAVCEIAKTHTKSSGSTVDNATASVSGSLKAYSLTAVTAAAALLSPLMANQAQADVLCKGTGGQLFVKSTCGSSEETIDYLAFGANNTTTTAQGSNAFAAVGGQAQGNHTIAIGVNSIAKGDGTIALGGGESGNSFNKSGSYANGNGNIAIGKKAEAVGAKDIGFVGTSGNFTLPQGNYNDNGHQYSYKRTITENGSQMIAIGDNASAYNDQAIAIGGNTVATGYASISIGGDDIGLVGKRNTGTINYLKDTLIPELQKDGLDVSNTLNRTIQPNNGNIKPAFQDLTLAKGASSIAFGFKSVAEGELSNAFGTGARSVGLNSTAFGSFAAAFGKESIAFGTATETGNKADNSVALGYMSQVDGTNSAAVGQKNKVSKDNTFVLGNNVKGDLENSVYLGAGSTTKAQGGAAVTDLVNSATVGGITYGGFKGQTVQVKQNGEAELDAQGNTQVVGGIVSVGSAGKERRIKNVAAGRIGPNSTDAINGSQLYAVLPKYTDDGKGNATSVTVGNKTYNFGDGNDNTVTELTVNGGNAPGNQTGNLKLTDTGKNGNHKYDVSLNNVVTVGDTSDTSKDKPVTIDGSKGTINFTKNDGSVTGLAQHFTKTGNTTAPKETADTTSGKADNQAATVGDVKNVGWNLKVGGGKAKDFINHGDTVNFGNGKGTTAQFAKDAKTGETTISFDIAKAKNPTVPTTGNNAGKVTGGTGDKYWDSTQVQTAINNAGWFVNSGAVKGKGTNSGAAKTLVKAGDEVKFIAGDGMNIVQNGTNFTFNAKIVDNNGKQLKLDKNGNYVVGIVDPSGKPVTVNNNGEFVVGGGSNSGGGTGKPFTITGDDGSGKPSTTEINGVAKTEGAGVTFVGDENVKVIKQPTKGGDGTDVAVGLQNVVNVGGTQSGANSGKPNAGAVTIDGTKGGNSIAISTDGKGNLKVGNSNKNNAAPIKITNVKAGDNGTQDAVNVNQIEQVVGAANRNAKGAVSTKGSDGKEYTLKTYNVNGQTEYLTNNVVEAVSKMNEQGIKFFHVNDGTQKPVAQAKNKVDSQAFGKNAVAIGVGSIAEGKDSIAIGTRNKVSGKGSGAIGDPNEVSGSGSYVLGNNNKVTTNNTFVLGSNVTNTAANSVFLGDNSAQNTKGAGATGTVNNATVGDITYSGFAGAKADGMVAVGNASQVRRVSGVAAGEISATSTDAINGSQLYSALSNSGVYVTGNGAAPDDTNLVKLGDKKGALNFVDGKGTTAVVKGNTVTFDTVPGYAEGIKAGDNVTFNYEDNKDAAGNQLYVTTTGGTTTDATDPNVKVDATGKPVKQQTTVINANLKPLQDQVQHVENNAYAGVAQAMATAGLPQAYLPGKSMVAIAGGQYKGEQGYALGVSSISDSGNWVFKATASGNSRGNVGGTIGAGYQW